MKLRKLIFVMTLLFVLGFATFLQVSAATRLTLGTSVSGGTYFILGGAWSKIVGENLEEIMVSVQEGGGPATNIQLIQEGKMELGYGTVNVAYQGWHGIDWAEGKKYDKIRSIFPSHASCMHLYTLASSEIKSIYDFEGRHVSTGTPGNTSEIAGKAVLKLLGIEPSKISMLSLNGQVDALKDNMLDANISVTGVPGPFMLNLETTHNVRFIGLSDSDLDKITKEYPSFSAGAIPKGIYKNLKEDVPTVAFWNIMMASADLPDDLVYNLVKVTFDNQDKLITADPVAKQTLPENIKNSVIPLHPGAIKYYREIGVEIPEHLISPN